MSVKEMKASLVSSDDKWLYRATGIISIIFFAAYLAIIALYMPLGKPAGAEAWLASMAKHPSVWWAILGLSVLTDILLIPVALSLYRALNEISQDMMTLAAAFMGLFVILDLALTWTNYASLIALGGAYAAAANDLQRANFVAAALYPASIVDSNLLFVYNSLTLAVGILLTSIVMLKGKFCPIASIFGIATGVLGIVAVAGSFFGLLKALIVLVSILTMVWILLVGFRLNKLGSEGR